MEYVLTEELAEFGIFNDVSDYLNSEACLSLMASKFDSSVVEFFESIFEYGIKDPVHIIEEVYTRNLILINGHHRVLAAIILGISEIPAIIEEERGDTWYEFTSGPRSISGFEEEFMSELIYSIFDDVTIDSL